MLKHYIPLEEKFGNVAPTILLDHIVEGCLGLHHDKESLVNIGKIQLKIVPHD